MSPTLLTLLGVLGFGLTFLASATLHVRTSAGSVEVSAHIIDVHSLAQGHQSSQLALASTGSSMSVGNSSSVRESTVFFASCQDAAVSSANLTLLVQLAGSRIGLNVPAPWLWQLSDFERSLKSVGANCNRKKIEKTSRS